MYVYPRVDQQVLLRLINEYRREAASGDAAVERVRDMVDGQVLAPGRISHSPVGVEAVNEEHLWELRRGLRSIADRYGCPTERYSKRSPRWADYDRDTAAHLHSEMKVLPTDAGSRDVWSHMNAWLVPDLVLWRWWVSDESPNVGDPRFGWGTRWFPRNQMGRLWWRQEILGDLYSEGRLGEDQVTAIFERPSLGFNPPLARSIARRWTLQLDRPGGNAEELMRDATKRLRRMLPWLSIYSLSERQIDEVVDDAFGQALVALGREGAS